MGEDLEHFEYYHWLIQLQDVDIVPNIGTLAQGTMNFKIYEETYLLNLLSTWFVCKVAKSNEEDFQRNYTMHFHYMTNMATT